MQDLTSAAAAAAKHKSTTQPAIDAVQHTHDGKNTFHRHSYSWRFGRSTGGIRQLGDDLEQNGRAHGFEEQFSMLQLFHRGSARVRHAGSIERERSLRNRVRHLHEGRLAAMVQLRWGRSLRHTQLRQQTVVLLSEGARVGGRDRGRHDFQIPPGGVATTMGRGVQVFPKGKEHVRCQVDIGDAKPAEEPRTVGGRIQHADKGSHGNPYHVEICRQRRMHVVGVGHLGDVFHRLFVDGVEGNVGNPTAVHVQWIAVLMDHLGPVQPVRFLLIGAGRILE